jgi:hypothetical protein
MLRNVLFARHPCNRLGGKGKGVKVMK